MDTARLCQLLGVTCQFVVDKNAGLTRDCVNNCIITYILEVEYI